ncbi:PIN2/TERF1-interacting telomerase inhibitor 1 [Scomber scombrus]
MLERMGWSKGKGLGRTEQGSTEHIKVKVKNNSYGLGTSVSHEDNWIAHQDDFNELLAQLNNCHGQSNNTEPPPEEQKGFSLEEKSKTSKKRVHYMKFTKGKDLSSRSKTDLDCIFGKRARSATEPEQESNSSDSQGEKDNVTIAPTEIETEKIANTVTSTLTMQEYFAQRMAQLKKARGQTQSTETNEISGPSKEPSLIHGANENTEEPKKKKKKKKKAKKDEDEMEGEVVEAKCTAPIVVEVDEEQEPLKKKKKKKRKAVENEGGLNENCSSTSGVEQDCEEMPPYKKKKLKKHTKETELIDGLNGVTDDQTVESEVVHKKKKKSREEVHDVVEEDKEELVVKKSKKDKKKKHKN